MWHKSLLVLVSLEFMNKIDPNKLLDWVCYMEQECYGDPESGQEIFGVDGYREGIALLSSLRWHIEHNSFC